MSNNLLGKIEEVPRDKKLIIFDLDGTLTESKSYIDKEMAGLLEKLIERKPVAIIGGGKYQLFVEQFVSRINVPEKLLGRLYLFPASGTAFYKYKNGSWNKIYAHEFSSNEKKKIFDAFEQTFRELDYVHPSKVYGIIIEDRGTQITFSALGQEAPLELKKKWKEENTDLKLKIADTLRRHLPDMSVGAAGYTSIDVTNKGIDKAYGIRQISKELGIAFEDMIFVGDALFPGGNDYAALRTGVECFAVKEVSDTKKLIRHLLN
jgi:HAD superfamily hydrolase (TIGR01484 family)